MRLWIDGQCLQTGSRLRGIGRYVTQLIRAIGEHCPQVEMSISFNATLPDAAILARGDVAPWIAPRNIHVWQGLAHGGESGRGHTADYRLSEAAIAHHMAYLAPDIALSASPFEGQYDPVTPLLGSAGHAIPRAAIFYDVIPYRFASRYLAKDKERRCYNRRIAAHRGFDLLLAISGFAAHEAEDILPGVPVVRIDAGISPDFIALSQRPRDESALARLGVAKPFLLYVGGFDWRKNLDRMREAMARLPSPFGQLQFVLAGDTPARWLARYRAEWTGAGLAADRLVALGHITDEDLVQLYSHADLVIQPSLMEGFGLTALEAMFCGAPVIAADAGALPEVVGDSRALFDPENPAMIADRIAQFLSDPALAHSLVAAGIARAANFSWERTARAAVTALEAAMRAPQPASREQLRRITRASLGPVPKPERAALILAAAEPRPAPARPRLLIEVGYTAGNDHGTGIQRVVKGIAGAMMVRAQSEQLLEPQLCFCDSADGFFPATIDAAGKIALTDKKPEQKLVPAAGDQVLMLDSSWTSRAVFLPVLSRARLQGAEVVSVLYDLAPLKMPAFCDRGMSDAFALWLQSALTYSSAFVCISRAVADELLALLEAVRFPKPLRVGYWRLGAQSSVAPAAGGTAVSTPSAPMFLMVSTLEPRKGYRVALDAFTLLWREGFEGTLTIIGRQGWATQHLVEDMKSHPEWGGKLHWLENASDDVLTAHYAASTALIASAYAEGFGLPIVEAVMHGKPVIASDIPVFREVAGEGAHVTYFPVGSPEGLAAALRDFVRRPPATMPPQDPPLSWPQSAAQLERMLAGGPWYRTYLPPTGDAAPGKIGDFAPPPPATAAGRRHRLELVEGPIFAKGGIKGKDAVIRFVVRVTNLSDQVWSSAGGKGPHLGIRLGIRPEGGGKSRFSKIPLVHIPGEAHFMMVELAVRDIGRAKRAQIALVQGRHWWEDGLSVGLTSSKMATR